MAAGEEISLAADNYVAVRMIPQRLPEHCLCRMGLSTEYPRALGNVADASPGNGWSEHFSIKSGGGNRSGVNSGYTRGAPCGS
jgi:hypothetical protein